MSMRKERKSLVLDIVGFQELGPIFESQIYCLHKYLFEYNQMREVQRNLTFRFYGKNKRSFRTTQEQWTTSNLTR